MLINPKFHHLVEAVVYIAINSKPDAVRGPEICQAQDLPPRYLEPDLQKLVRHGVLRSLRGPRGGYVLASERRNITLADIYTGSGMEDPGEGKAYIADALKEANAKYIEELAKITIETLCARAGQVTGGSQKADFAI